MDAKQMNLEDLSARVAKLEAQTRRWKLASTLLGLTGACAVIIAAKPGDRLEPPVIRAGAVEAQRFILKDEDGRVFARLTFKDEHKRMSANIIGKTSPAALEFYDEQGDVALTVPGVPGLVPTK